MQYEIHWGGKVYYFESKEAALRSGFHVDYAPTQPQPQKELDK